eukprot:jgi/Bigna1/86201/estExt_fgenesh1_pg.C_80309
MLLFLPVLSDVTCALLSPTFMKELFKPQVLYTQKQLLKVFHELAHASIMRLNEGSMGKLHDLMNMGIKYQIMSLKLPSQLLDVTCNHMDGIEDLLDGANEACKLVKSARSKVMAAYAPLSNIEWNQIRKVILTYFQDWKVKISTFLKLGIQSNNGDFVMTHEGDFPGCSSPGTVRGKDGLSITLKPKNAVGTRPLSSSCFVTHGINVWYAKISAKESMDRAKKGAKDRADYVTKARLTASAGLMANAKEAKIDAASAEAAKAELNALANLLTGSKPSTTKDNFTLKNLFAPSEVVGSKPLTMCCGQGDAKDVVGEQGEIVSFGGNSDAWTKKLQSKIGDLEKIDTAAGEVDDDDDDDLLALMDG